MIRVAWKGLAARPVRTALTTLAIVVGVAFVCAAYTLTDTMSGAADSLTHAAYDGTDAVIVSQTAFKGSQTSDIRAVAPTVDVAELQKVRESLAMLGARATSIHSTLQNLQRSQAASGLGMRGDWVQSASLMDSFLRGADDALRAGDAASAKDLMEKGERQVEKLEKALNK